MPDSTKYAISKLFIEHSMHTNQALISDLVVLVEQAIIAEAEIGITTHDLGKLESLRKLCIDEDLLDLNSYDSIGRSNEISNAWEALTVIEDLVKKLTKKD